MNMPEAPKTPAQDAYDAALDSLVDKGNFSYDEARARLSGSSMEQDARIEVWRQKGETALKGTTLTLGQAAEVLVWYHAAINRDDQGNSKYRAVPLERAAARVSSDLLEHRVNELAPPLLTPTESWATYDYITSKPAAR